MPPPTPDPAPSAVHDIVQITDATHPWYPCLLVVTEVKSWGIQGFAFIPQSNDGSAPVAQAFNRLPWAWIEKVGTAVIIPARLEDDGDTQ